MKSESEKGEKLADATDLTKDSKDIYFDFDVILEYYGNMGCFQALVAVFILYAAIPVGMHGVGAVFLLGIPEHRCHISGIDGNASFANYSEESILNASIPTTESGYEKCLMYDYNYSDCINDGNLECTDPRLNPSTVPCQQYKYSRGEYGNTVVSEFNLVCDQLILGTTSNAVFYTGGLVGGFLSGNISDNIGRRLMLLIGALLTAICGIACAFSPTLAMYSVMRFIISLSTMTSFSVGFVYVMEVLGKKWRVIIGAIYNSAYAVGYTVLSPMAYYWRDWRELQIAMSLVSVPFLLMWILLPESPRWQFARGRHEDGKATSNLIAKRNGFELPSEVWVKSLRPKEDVENVQIYSTITLFRQREMRKVTGIVMFCWFVASLGYFGISLNIGAYAGDVYVNNALSGLAEVIAGPIAMVAIKKIGRRMSTSGSYIIAGVMCIVSSFVNFCSPDLGILATTLALLGKLAISTTFAVIFVYTSELYPTVVRALAVSTGAACAFSASIITPYALFLQNYVAWLPGVIFGTAGILAGIATLYLRETRDHKMLTTLEEAEQFYKK